MTGEQLPATWTIRSTSWTAFDPVGTTDSGFEPGDPQAPSASRHLQCLCTKRLQAATPQLTASKC
ncbi:hypothetical protein DPMN_187791 [Dreissena polymorpha]|uniref:Uncharacterized protein n=1 Tax=Dreissena polymorpha TaxID=45954 RepID=A0A9D4I9D2_DREPO|nr:hypothetical protein DPMN_187791 [Dreissena polymorpha]